MTYKINKMPKQVAAPLLEKCARAETATVGHIRQMGFANREIQNVLGQRTTIAGTAVTLAIPGQDATLLHHIVQYLRPGDILCIDRLGETKHACVGGLVAAAIAATKCAGVIIDGPCTDTPEIEHYGLPIWCRGTAPITTRLYNIGGSFNVPVCIGGAVVNPGDVVIADFSGVLIMPPGEADADVDWALAKQSAEPADHERVLAGERLGDLTGASAKVTTKLAGG